MSDEEKTTGWIPVAVRVSPEEFARLSRHRERWKFLQPLEPDNQARVLRYAIHRGLDTMDLEVLGDHVEFLVWFPRSTPPNTDRQVIGLYKDDVYPVRFDAASQRFVERGDDGVATPIDVELWSEMPTGKKS